MKFLPLLPLFLLVLMPAVQPAMAVTVGATPNPIQHVVVIVQENHTFDNYFGTYPGANGIQNDPPTVHPYHITGPIVDLCHSTICANAAYDKGRMDGFAQSEGTNETFGYFDKSDIPYYWSLAQNYTLFDNYFTSEMGPSLPNHLYLVSAQDDGVADSITNQHGDLNIGSIANTLQAAHDTWAYYSPYTAGNENALGLVSSVAGNATMSGNLKTSEQFLVDLANHNMANVSYITADDGVNEHPPYSVSTGEQWVEGIISAIQASPYWGSTMILITWDDYGGWYDHVTPPQVDRYGDGFRVPLLMVSPFARSGYIDHTLSDHTSIMKFIERVFGLPPVSQRDAMASDLFDALNANFTNRYTDDSFSMQGTPTYSNANDAPAFDAYAYAPSVTFSFMNNLGHSQPAIFTAALRNNHNQTLQLLTVKGTIPPGKTVQVPFTFKNQPPGAYTLSIIAMKSKGVALSEPFRELLNSTGASQTVTS